MVRKSSEYIFVGFFVKNNQIPDFSKKSGIYVLSMITNAVEQGNDE
jgi:hypothetical protein